ncbi:MAG: hypothetical protein DMD63_04390 [Gemmatimonadetes bacterium]|nr:MAG: hypothetical protein DMD63_04390 [Gemmatimonadota bacterium]
MASVQGIKSISSTRIGPDNSRYRAVVEKRFNKRYSASPDYIRLVSSTDQVVSAVQEAVSEGSRLVVTSGGHCLEGFVSDPDVRVILDVSPMKRIYYDAEMRAIAVEAGATSASIQKSAWADMSSAAPLDFSAASSDSPRIIYTPSRLSPSTKADARAVSWRLVKSQTRIASCGGRTLVEAVATSASSPVTGFAQPMHPATIPPACFRAHQNRLPPSERNGTGATSTSRRSCDFYETTEPGRSETATLIRRTRRSGLCSSSIAGSSGRSSSVD